VKISLRPGWPGRPPLHCVGRHPWVAVDDRVVIWSLLLLLLWTRSAAWTSVYTHATPCPTPPSWRHIIVTSPNCLAVTSQYHSDRQDAAPSSSN